MRIEIKSSVVAENSGIAAKSGKPYCMRKQTGWAFTHDNLGAPNPYPERIEINLSPNNEGYPVGFYTVEDQSFCVGDFNQLSVGNLVLRPIPPVRATP